MSQTQMEKIPVVDVALVIVDAVVALLSIVVVEVVVLVVVKVVVVVVVTVLVPVSKLFYIMNFKTAVFGMKQI